MCGVSHLYDLARQRGMRGMAILGVCDVFLTRNEPGSSTMADILILDFHVRDGF